MVIASFAILCLTTSCSEDDDWAEEEYATLANFKMTRSGEGSQAGDSLELIGTKDIIGDGVLLYGCLANVNFNIRVYQNKHSFNIFSRVNGFQLYSTGPTSLPLNANPGCEIDTLILYRNYCRVKIDIVQSLDVLATKTYDVQYNRID